MNNQKIIVILGPTASGKSDMAVTLAEKFGSEVISADSRQVYKDLDIGTGKLTKKEMLGVPHHCLSYASPKRVHTVSDYKKCASKILLDIASRNLVPIICGGTGLYIDAVLKNINIPNVKPNPQLRKKLEKFSVLELYEKLKKLDPRRAKTLFENSGYKNKRRLVRAIEIIEVTGKKVPMRSSRTTDGIPATKYNVLWLGIKLLEKKLKKRIHDRLIKRLSGGLVQEVKNLHDKSGLSFKRLYDLGLEYRCVSLYLQNKLSKEEMVKKLEKEIWYYSKRQMTWFSRNKKINWIANKKEAYRLVNKFIDNP